jgi:hypothetical protein
MITRLSNPMPNRCERGNRLLGVRPIFQMARCPAKKESENFMHGRNYLIHECLEEEEHGPSWLNS